MCTASYYVDIYGRFFYVMFLFVDDIRIYGHCNDKQEDVRNKENSPASSSSVFNFPLLFTKDFQHFTNILIPTRKFRSLVSS